MTHITWTAICLCFTVYFVTIGEAWWVIAISVALDLCNIYELVIRAKRGSL